jgi:hypothetical protein
VTQSEKLVAVDVLSEYDLRMETYADFITQILDQMEGKSNRQKAEEIAKRFGKRVRRRARGRERARRPANDFIRPDRASHD